VCLPAPLLWNEGICLYHQAPVGPTVYIRVESLWIQTVQRRFDYFHEIKWRKEGIRGRGAGRPFGSKNKHRDPSIDASPMGWRAPRSRPTAWFEEQSPDERSGRSKILSGERLTSDCFRGGVEGGSRRSRNICLWNPAERPTPGSAASFRMYPRTRRCHRVVVEISPAFDSYPARNGVRWLEGRIWHAMETQ